MTKRLRSAALVILICVVSTNTVPGADNARLKKEFKALYATQAELVGKRDVKALMEFNLPEHSVKLLNGNSISRQQLEQGMRDFYTNGRLVRQISFNYKVLSVTVRGDEAVVLVEQKDKRIQVRRDGLPHKVEANVIHRDTWVLTAAGWRRRLTEEVRQTKFTVDGEPAEAGE